MVAADDLGQIENRHRAVSLRYHARARHGYWGSRWAALLPPSWDEEPNLSAWLAQIARQGYVEAGDAVLPSSEDGWGYWSREHGDAIFGPDVEDYGASGGKLTVGVADKLRGSATPTPRVPPADSPAWSQARWEAQEASRREALRLQSDTQWQAEVERRRIASEARMPTPLAAAERHGRAERRAREFAEAQARETAEFLASWEQEPARRVFAAGLALDRTAAGELTPVSWQTEGLYRVEGARRVLRQSRNPS